MAHTHLVESGGGDDKQHDNSFVTRSELFTILKQVSSVSQFYELEVFEVLDVYRVNGAITTPGVVRGRYLREPNKESFIEFGPINSNILQYPVVGELWLGINYTIDQSKPHYIGRISKDANDVNDLPDYGDSAKGEERSIDTIIPELQVLNSNRLRKDYRQGLTFNSPPNVPKLFASEGDTIIQGRFGNSIRLGSNQEEGEEFIQSPNIKLVSGLNIGQEDLDDDKSSVYLTSNEFVDYPNPAFSVMGDEYTNPQIVIDSDRLVLNAKKDSIGIYAEKDINIQSVSGDVAINSEDKITLKPKNSTIDFDIKNGGMILNSTKEGIPFPQLDMVGFLKQVTGIQQLFKALTIGVPKLSAVATLPSGVKDIVKGLEGAKNFIDATINLEFLSKALMETKTIEEIKAVLPIPAGFGGIIDDISNITDDQIKKLQELEDAASEQIKKASELQSTLSGTPPNVAGVSELLAGGDFDNFSGVEDLKSVIAGGADPEALQNYIENGGLTNFEDEVSDLGSVIGSTDQAKSYKNLFNTARS